MKQHPLNSIHGFAQRVDMKHEITLRPGLITDLPSLLLIEESCFTIERLSKRSFRRHLQSAHSILVVAETAQHNTLQKVVGYGLCLLNRGTRLARLYSLAVLPAYKGLSIGARLLEQVELQAASQGRLFMRLEVAKTNTKAIALYEAKGYRKFGEYLDYYEDHTDANRMQKTIRQVSGASHRLVAAWYRQTTDFTCGPAALIMAMASLNKQMDCNQALELDLWRESTTIFMTSGLGGTHPFGLALAAHRRGFKAEVFVNSDQALFIDGVRSEEKKTIMSLVHDQFKSSCKTDNIIINYVDVTQVQLEEWLIEGLAVIILISTYRLDGKKAPHWVLVTGIDGECLYENDPDVDEKRQVPLDCQHMPIAREDFVKMSTFGSTRLRCAITIGPNELNMT